MTHSLTVPVYLEQPARVEFTEPTTGQAASFDLYDLYAAVMQAKAKAVDAGDESVQWSALTEYLNSQFSPPVNFAQNQLREIAESAEQVFAAVAEARKKKVVALHSSVTSTLELLPTP